jgi:transposase
MGPLVFFDKRLKSEEYIDILKKDLLPWYNEVKAQLGDNVMFQEDNAPWHVSKATTAWKKEHHLDLLENWPPQSPDLNLIENLWAELERRLKKVSHKIKDMQSLKDQLKKQWDEMSLEFITGLVWSMPERCQAVIDAEGYPTRY